tara:strand:+ start:653 stop:1189 length:537 start_codon:yes stop_codon:yes gene_type:complete
MKIIVVISGFTQKNHQNTGSKQLWRELRMLDDLCESKDSLIELKEWDSDWKAYAEHINSLEPTEVLICCYSWGGGYGMPQLSKRLECDVSVVACDPVYRSPTIFGRWWALFDRNIKLDKNVKVVGWLSQRGDYLDGDKLVGGKSICLEQTFDYDHTSIDNSPEYHRMAVIAAKTYLQA